MRKIYTPDKPRFMNDDECPTANTLKYRIRNN